MSSTRYEKKMVCDEVHLPAVRSWVRLHPGLFSVAHPPRQVNNLYFDSVEADCLRYTLEGISDRAKLRYRWYGDSYTNVQGILELKRKSNKIGWKVHCQVPGVIDLTTISWPELMGQLRRHAHGEVGLWLSVVDQPMLINSFTREYYETEAQEVRLTIDHSQKAFEQWMQPRPNLTLGAVRSRNVVVEIKVESGLAHQLPGASSPFPLRVGRNSKYETGVLDALEFLNRSLR
jgi:hypothetical protein